MDNVNRKLITIPGLLSGRAGATVAALLILQAGYQQRVNETQKKRNLSTIDRLSLIHDARVLSSLNRQLAGRG